MVWMGLWHREGANADVASNVQIGNDLRFEKGSGLSNGVTDPVSL